MSMPLPIVYPRPLALYQTVVLDANIFKTTLETFHRTLGTKLRYPSLGGVVLDLHKLFAEVTNHGGSLEVFVNNKWKEVAAVFEFPAKVKQAHLKVRDRYMEFVYHYEQVYFLNAVSCLYVPGNLIIFFNSVKNPFYY
ncbi:hypothetical protein V2J09_021796 [Rumex salicifolius]